MTHGARVSLAVNFQLSITVFSTKILNLSRKGGCESGKPSFSFANCTLSSLLQKNKKKGMSKAVVSGLLTTAFLIIFVVINPTVQKRQKNLHLARRLGHNRAAFDPLVEEIEEKVMQASDHRSLFSSLNIFLNDVHDQYEFVSQVKNLNITMRLMVLFPLLDLEPRDGFVSLKELEHWNLQQAIHRLNYRTHKELASLDQNEDGSITLKEYLSKLSYKGIARTAFVLLSTREKTKETFSFFLGSQMGCCDLDLCMMENNVVGRW